MKIPPCVARHRRGVSPTRQSGATFSRQVGCDYYPPSDGCPARLPCLGPRIALAGTNCEKRDTNGERRDCDFSVSSAQAPRVASRNAAVTH